LKRIALRCVGNVRRCEWLSRGDEYWFAQNERQCALFSWRHYIGLCGGEAARALARADARRDAKRAF
jgi:hypothetical protein